MSDGDNITRREFKLNNKNINDQLTGVCGDVVENKELITKLSLIIIGNGEGGLIMKVNNLLLRNHWADKAFWVALTVAINIFSLYLAGVLHL